MDFTQLGQSDHHRDPGLKHIAVIQLLLYCREALHTGGSAIPGNTQHKKNAKSTILGVPRKLIGKKTTTQKTIANIFTDFYEQLNSATQQITK